MTDKTRKLKIASGNLLQNSAVSSQCLICALSFPQFLIGEGASARLSYAFSGLEGASKF
jgi:hypothetical protein